ncbi:hypothetical protein ACERIT_03595 [Halopenitus sp. H-Gu1]|uniref:DUF7117 family protein n=1 Tax=Halopenitus sp. H-Gu1 TaxID=3242697 RepID=UPI00359DF901
MKVRGERECTECDTRWSYYETGSITCPDCGSMRSVGVDERRRHTDSPVELDLSEHRLRFGEAAGTLPEDGHADLEADLRAYVHRRGFIRGGELLPLDDVALAARELLQALDVYGRLADPTDHDREYLLRLLDGADDGERPAPGTVPDRLRAARGLAYANAIDAYREDLTRYLDDMGADTADDSGPDVDLEAARDVLESLRDRIRRVESLHGDVDPDAIETLVRAANDLGRYLREGDATALSSARERVSGSTQ